VSRAPRQRRRCSRPTARWRPLSTAVVGNFLTDIFNQLVQLIQDPTGTLSSILANPSEWFPLLFSSLRGIFIHSNYLLVGPAQVPGLFPSAHPQVWLFTPRRHRRRRPMHPQWLERGHLGRTKFGMPAPLGFDRCHRGNGHWSMPTAAPLPCLSGHARTRASVTWWGHRSR